MKHHHSHGRASTAPHQGSLTPRRQESAGPVSSHERGPSQKNRKQVPVAALHSVRKSWRRRLEETIRQSALIHTQTSLAALRMSSISFRPRGVFVGLGLCSGLRSPRRSPWTPWGISSPQRRSGVASMPQSSWCSSLTPTPPLQGPTPSLWRGSPERWSLSWSASASAASSEKWRSSPLRRSTRPWPTRGSSKRRSTAAL